MEIRSDAQPQNLPAVGSENRPRKCLSCGNDPGSSRRRYCSVACRQNLRRKLNARTGLLRALNTRFGAFYFTDSVVALDILPCRSKEIFSFIFPRTRGASPAEDFCKMSDALGNAWWAERRRTNRKYLANRLVFEQAQRNDTDQHRITPLEIRTPTVPGQHLIHLRLGRKDLESRELARIIKNAFRNQAMRHHPDKGGNSQTFRKILMAYEEMLSWAEAPTFITRRGFPDKWFYDGSRNRWVQPTPDRSGV
ncbi:MAG: J domain-containing protein [Desulfobacterales bacterium]|jgi:hypothetical protein